MSTGHRLLDAVLDAEVESLELIEQQTGRLDIIQSKLKALSRKLYKLRIEEKIGRAESKQMFRTAFAALLLEEYTHDLPSLVAMTDRHLREQVEALEATGSKGLRPLKSEEVKQRASAKALEAK